MVRSEPQAAWLADAKRRSLILPHTLVERQRTEEEGPPTTESGSYLLLQTIRIRWPGGCAPWSNPPGSGLHRRPDLEDHHRHQVHQRREQQIPGILLLRDSTEKPVEHLGTERILHRHLRHSANRTCLDESLQYLAQYEGRRACRQAACPDIFLLIR